MPGNSQEDMLAVLRYLEEKIQSGECVGIAFAATFQEGRAARGYAGAIKEQPEMTVGILSMLSHDILDDTRERNNPISLE